MIIVKTHLVVYETGMYIFSCLYVFYLANKAIAALRGIPGVQEIFYILCNPDAKAMHNFYEYALCDFIENELEKKTGETPHFFFQNRLAAGERSKLQSSGAPFIPACIYPVDLLPHTTHTDIVVKCVRT
jgi:hypothetical protein